MNKTVGLKDRRKNSFGWVAERSIATVLHTSQRDKHQRSRARTSGEQHRQVRSANKTVGLKDRRKNSFGWVRAAVDCDGLAYESARQAQRSRARTSGEQHRQVRSANKTVGLKDRRRKKFRMGGRAVDCDGLENRCGGNSTGGSNPSPSARK